MQISNACTNYYFVAFKNFCRALMQLLKNFRLLKGFFCARGWKINIFSYIITWHRRIQPGEIIEATLIVHTRQKESGVERQFKKVSKYIPKKGNTI